MVIVGSGEGSISEIVFHKIYVKGGSLCAGPGIESYRDCWELEISLEPLLYCLEPFCTKPTSWPKMGSPHSTPCPGIVDLDTRCERHQVWKTPAVEGIWNQSSLGLGEVPQQRLQWGSQYACQKCVRVQHAIYAYSDYMALLSQIDGRFGLSCRSRLSLALTSYPNLQGTYDYTVYYILYEMLIAHTLLHILY